MGKNKVEIVGIDTNKLKVLSSEQSLEYLKKYRQEGNKELRCLLYLSIQNTVQRNNVISKYYHKKIATGVPPKVAKVACMNKLLRIIYSMCKFGVIYQ